MCTVCENLIRLRRTTLAKLQEMPCYQQTLRKSWRTTETNRKPQQRAEYLRCKELRICTVVGCCDKAHRKTDISRESGIRQYTRCLKHLQEARDNRRKLRKVVK